MRVFFVTRRSGRLAMVLFAISLAGCYPTNTEVIKAGNSARVFGDHLVLRDTAADEATMYRWNGALKAYVGGDSPEKELIARIARLKGAVYLVQSTLRAEKKEMGFLLALVRITSRSDAELLLCENREELVDYYNLHLTVNDVLAGERESIVAYLAEMSTACEGMRPDYTIVAAKFDGSTPELSSSLRPKIRKASSRGSIRGVITDESGAPFPGVTVSIQEAETGVEKHEVTTVSGAYRFSDLAPGQYVVTAVCPSGFSVKPRTVELRDAMTMTVDLVLSVDTTRGLALLPVDPLHGRTALSSKGPDDGPTGVKPSERWTSSSGR